MCLGLIEASGRTSRDHRASRRIRGRCASASLKLALWGAILGGPGCIRGRCASASLKPSAAVVRRGGTAAAYPRQKCVSASLKQISIRVVGSFLCCIRGARASASLKGSLGVQRLRHRRRIRGIRASASLKLGVVRLTWGPHLIRFGRILGFISGLGRSVFRRVSLRTR